SCSTDLRVCQRAAAHLDLHSFPTRRSSDLFPKGGEAKGEALPGYDGVVLYDRARDGGSDLAHYLVEGAARSIFLQFRDRRVRERSEEHTSELQSRFDLVCRLLLEKKNHD